MSGSVGGPVRVLDVSYRGRSWQLHDLGRATWLVYPWFSTNELWGQVHAVEWAARASRWEAIDRAGAVARFGSFADAAKYACGYSTPSITDAPVEPPTRAADRLTDIRLAGRACPPGPSR